MPETADISKNIIEKAKLTASKIDDTSLRKRAFALNIAAGVAAEYITNAGLETDTALSLFRIPSFARNLEFADIYINGLRLDVRISFDGKTFCVPKVHEIYDAKPYAYVVVELEKGLKTAKILGFVPADDLEKTETKTEYYGYNTSVLRPMQELRVFLSTIEFKQHVYSAVEHDKIKELCTSFIDNEISESEKVYFIKHVIACPVCRETFCDMNDFDVIVSQVKNYEELLNDSTLSVLSGNKKEVDEAAIAGMALVENAQEETDSAAQDEQQTKEETIIRPMGAVFPDEIQVEAEEQIQEDFSEEQPEEAAVLEENTEQPELLNDESELLLEVEPENLELDQQEFETLEEQTVTEENSQEEQDIDEPASLQIEESDMEINLEPVENVNDESLDTLSSIEELETLTEPEQLIEDDNLIEELPAEELPLEEVHIDEPAEKELEPVESSESDIISENQEEESIAPLEMPEELSAEPEMIDFQEDALPELQSLEEKEDQTAHQDDEVQENKAQEEVISYAQEPVELVYDEEEPVSEEISDLQSVTEYSEEVQTEPEIQTEQQEPDADIQGLLDDDLLASLSEDSDDEVQTAQVPEQNNETVSDEEFMFDEEQDNETEFQPESQQPEEDTIESLYSETNVPAQDGENPAEFELAKEPVSAKTVNATKKIITAAAIFLILAGGSALSWYFNHAKTVQDASLDTANQDGEFFDLQNKGSNTEETPAVSQDINKSMTNSFSDKPAAITITKLSWQVSEKLAAEASVKEYLQTAGKNIQMNLQNDLANSADINFNNVIKVSFEIAPDNTLKGIQVLESSGSDQIDDIVVRSIKNTLKYVSVPKLKDMKSDYFLTLIINF